MKNFVIFMMIVLFCSCNKAANTGGDEEIGGDVGDFVKLNLEIVIVDADLNDRLNPESPSFWGEDYTEGIEVMYLYDGKKITFLENYRLIGGGSLFFVDDVENLKPISSPRQGINTLGYYFIDHCHPFTAVPIIEDEQKVTYAYICYPDGSEDEIKCQIWINETESVMVIGKIWINRELAYDMRGAQGEYGWERYYNPKYYPWLEPVLDDEGKQMGVKPKDYATIVVITR